MTDGGERTVIERIPWQLQALRTGRHVAGSPPTKPQAPKFSTQAAPPRGHAREESALDRTLLQVGMDARMAEILLAEKATKPSSSPPESGVRVTEALPAAAGGASDEALSFQVYTVEELARRTTTRVKIPKALVEARGVSGAVLLRTMRMFVSEVWRWVRLGRKAGCPARVALDGPYTVLREDARSFLRTTDWRRLGAGVGLGLGTVAALLFVVVTVAELSDDLKPASTRAVHLTTATLAETTPSNATPLPADTLAQPPVATNSQAPVATTPEPYFEVDAPRPDARHVAKSPVPARSPARKAGTEVFTP